MAKAGFKIIDAEPHFLEPHGLWERNLPEPFRSKTKVTSLDQGKTGEGVDAVGEGRAIEAHAVVLLIRDRSRHSSV